MIDTGGPGCGTFMPWSGAVSFGEGAGFVDAVSMIESNYGNPGKLELIARIDDTLQFFWRDSGPAFNWNRPYLFETGVTTAAPTALEAVASDGSPATSEPLSSTAVLPPSLRWRFSSCLRFFARSL